MWNVSFSVPHEHKDVYIWLFKYFDFHIWGSQMSVMYFHFLLNACVCLWVVGDIQTLCSTYVLCMAAAENAYTKWFIRPAAFLVEPTAVDGDEQESESQISSPKVTIAHVHCNIAEHNQAKHWTATEAFPGTVIFIRIMLSSFGSMSVIWAMLCFWQKRWLILIYAAGCPYMPNTLFMCSQTHVN